jgi:hypothetical protein
MITYDELKTALTDISNICRMTDCDKCQMGIRLTHGDHCVLFSSSPNNWLDNISNQDMELFAQCGAQLVEDGYIDE